MKIPPPTGRWHPIRSLTIPETLFMTRSMLRPAILAVLAVTALCVRPVSAQATDADLLRENERLTAQVRDLEAALKAAMARIASLEGEIATLRTGGTSVSTAPKTPAPPSPSSDTPVGMIATIKAAFAKAVEDGEIERAASSRDEAGRIREFRALRKWVASANRTFKTTIEWPVVVLDSKVSSPAEGVLQVQVWDPATQTSASEPFFVSVPRRVVDRVNRPRSADEEGPAVFVLNGVFVPDIRVNENRTEVGPFDNPSFIAPMVEMTWLVEAKGVGQWTAAEATAVADED
jgi:hypothetical protein